jgi:hypothetical protein
MEQVRLDTWLKRCQERGWLKARGRQRPDSTAILGAVTALNQRELVGETLRHALNVVAAVAPAWLTPQIQPEWFARSAERIEDYRLPKDKAERDALSATIGEDGYTLLTSLDQAATQPEWSWLKEAARCAHPEADLGAAGSPGRRPCSAALASGHGAGQRVVSLTLRHGGPLRP